MMMNKKNSGFTLIELLVAMAIFSLMTVVAYAGISSVMLSDQTSLEHETALKRLQRTFLFIEKDFRQLNKRPRNDGFSELQQALKADGGGDVLLEFSRAGNSNPADASRSSLQRVRYIIEEEKLKRLSWNIIDHSDAEPLTMTLMDKVTEAKVAFFSSEGENLEAWTKSELPLGIEIKLSTERWGEIRRVFPVYY